LNVFNRQLRGGTALRQSALLPGRSIAICVVTCFFTVLSAFGSWTGCGPTGSDNCTTTNVGIGFTTASPIVPLMVRVPGTGPIFRMEANGGNSTVLTLAIDSMDAYMPINLHDGGGVSRVYIPNYGGHAYFNNLGNFGVGTTNPVGGKLHVYTTTNADGIAVDGTTNPAINFRNAGTVAGYLGLATQSTAFFTEALPNDLIIRSENNRVLIGRGSGASTLSVAGPNVGVGTATPVRRLDIEDISDPSGVPTTALRVGTQNPAYSGSGGAIELAAWNNRGASDPVGKIAAWLTNGTAGQQSGDLVFYTSSAGIVIERMRILADGRIGLNASAPSTTLDVGGNIHASGSITGGTVIGATYQDVAEWVPASESIAPGTVVIVDANAVNGVAPSNRPYDTAVAGVISARPGVLLGEEGPSKVKVATTGRVRVRVDASRFPIHPGDLLVSGDKPGMAMRSEPVEIAGLKMHRPGTLIGKALEPLESGEGEVLVLLSLQ
jgi:hypothetical protein